MEYGSSAVAAVRWRMMEMESPNLAWQRTTGEDWQSIGGRENRVSSIARRRQCPPGTDDKGASLFTAGTDGTVLLRVENRVLIIRLEISTAGRRKSTTR